MIRYVYANCLDAFPKLRDAMFIDRATQFKTRLKWEVTVDATGFEIDQYDTINPLYLIWETPDGDHGGSLRLLPTVGKTMVNDHFSDLTDGVAIESPLIWEVTRFCISPRLKANASDIASALLAGVCEIGLQFGLSDYVGVFDARMTRIYRRIGWKPTVLGQKGKGKDNIAVGLWEIGKEARDRICASSGICIDTPSAWFEASFPTQEQRLTA